MILPNLKYSKNGYKLTESFEACRFKAYPDAGGVMTIGWGHTRGVATGLTCNQLQADSWLVEDVAFAEAAVNDLIAEDSFPVTQDEFDALVDFVFNVGAEAFRKSTMLALLNQGDVQGAANEFSKWDHIKGLEVASLLRRRDAEKREFLFGPGLGHPMSEGAD